jgi:hypothetical protein
MYIFNFAAKKGDTYPGNYIFQVLVNNTPLDLTGAVIKADFKASPDHVVALTMISNGDTPKIEITDAQAGKFRFKKQIIDVKAGAYVYDVQITTQGGDVYTYLKGTLTVEQDITT